MGMSIPGLDEQFGMHREFMLLREFLITADRAGHAIPQRSSFNSRLAAPEHARERSRDALLDGSISRLATRRTPRRPCSGAALRGADAPP
jgi:hypothetical protein